MILSDVKQAMAAINPLKMADTDYKAKGFHLDVQVAPEQVVAAAEVLDKAAFTLEAVTGVDLLTFVQAAAKKPAAKKKAGDEAAAAAPEPEAPPAPPPVKTEPQMEVVYDFSHWRTLCRVVVRARVPRATPELPTISAVFAGADWHERETHDFFGIKFIGHPNLKPLLLPEDADFHPLRKDYKA